MVHRENLKKQTVEKWVKLSVSTENTSEAEKTPKQKYSVNKKMIIENGADNVDGRWRQWQ